MAFMTVILGLGLLFYILLGGKGYLIPFTVQGFGPYCCFGSKGPQDVALSATVRHPNPKPLNARQQSLVRL